MKDKKIIIFDATLRDGEQSPGASIRPFSHESGIHQDGFLKERSTYKIMMPESIGRPPSEIVLERHSGRHGGLSGK